ncbi:MAG: hypothetical protein QM630_02220 [Microbacterium sp.]
MNTTQAASSSLVAAVEDTWAAIQHNHADVPPVVVTLASGALGGNALKLGHFAADAWVHESETVHELFVGGEGLAGGGAEVLGTLLHEAAHGLAHSRAIRDTSRQGRYHNTKFKTVGEELGLTLAYDRKIGWSLTTVSDETVAHYSAQVVQLDQAIVAYRRQFSPATRSGGSNNGLAAECGCGRKIRASRSSLDVGPILCGVCKTPFTCAD